MATNNSSQQSASLIQHISGDESTPAKILPDIDNRSSKMHILSETTPSELHGIFQKFPEKLTSSHMEINSHSGDLSMKKPACFDSLPRELRDKIWRHSLPEPRVLNVDIVGGFWRQKFDYDENVSTPPHFYGVPNTLQICRESREISLTHYQPLLNEHDGYRSFFFNPSIDILRVGNTRYDPMECLGSYPPAKNLINGSIIRKLAVSQKSMRCETNRRYTSNILGQNLFYLAEFPNVTELYFVLGQTIHHFDQYESLQEANNASWETWNWNIEVIDWMGGAMAEALPQLEEALNMTPEFCVFSDYKMVFSKNEKGVNKYRRLHLKIEDPQDKWAEHVCEEDCCKETDEEGTHC